MRDDEKRILEFKPNKVNVITGDSGTGKTTVMEIIDYCFFASKTDIPHEIINENVKWYGLNFDINDKNYTLARGCLENKVKVSEDYYFSASGTIPDIPKVTINANEIKSILEKELSSLERKKKAFEKEEKLFEKDIIDVFRKAKEYDLLDENSNDIKENIHQLDALMKGLETESISTNFSELDTLKKQKELEDLEACLGNRLYNKDLVVKLLEELIQNYLDNCKKALGNYAGYKALFDYGKKSLKLREAKSSIPLKFLKNFN